MKYFTYGLLFLITQTVFSQNKGTLSNKEYVSLQDKVRSHFNSHIDSSFFYAAKIDKSDNIVHKAFVSGVKGYLYAEKGNFNNAKKHYIHALKLIDSAPNSYLKTQNESYIYNYGGIIDWKNGEFSKALDKYFIAKKISEEIGDLVQIVKINNNIAIINSDVENYKKAISTYRESNSIVDNNKYLFSDSQYSQNKSNINLNLGIFYEKYYFKNKDKEHLLDSAFYYYNKTIFCSKDIFKNKLKAQKNIGNIYLLKNDFVRASKVYYNILTFAKENNFQKEYYSANFNLGYLFYNQKKYDKALVYFKKVDSLYNSESDMVHLCYIYSNYFQAKIYNSYEDSENALKYSKIYLDIFEKNEFKQNSEALEVNYKLGNQDLEKEMTVLQKEHKNKVLLKNGLLGFLSIFLAGLIILFLKTNQGKKTAEKRVSEILEENKSNLNNQDLFSKTNTLIGNDEIKPKNGTSIISIDSEKKMMLQLKFLEDKLYYLKPEFTQQEVAKKIKTNTTYLSYVVNKNYNKSFSVYYNELRIDYVINEIINNTKYREYTTQAIAESAGFKNADSFASSFKKKTGMTPYRFVNEIKKRELI
ncbi:helix-turn-helix domain-containing protein [Flavobacterium sp.]|uniref:helix-turn-helix domain-containing protein n=1 Tax=Flavobacterium sp. TaxID=239 RepID=UPI002B4AF889|nr:helix-turn-helix domain-containing protein [Flavobacterium sp.]HLF50707.1 helix-turn-helix domain-containing protein [Flavobacterium sp.]